MIDIEIMKVNEEEIQNKITNGEEGKEKTEERNKKSANNKRREVG